MALVVWMILRMSGGIVEERDDLFPLRLSLLPVTVKLSLWWPQRTHRC